MNRPYLSLVLASRNDSYAGGMLRRVQTFVDSFLEQVNRWQLESELIVVDWNPPSDSPPLAEAVSWPDSGSSCTVRVIEVTKPLHEQCRFSEQLPILIHRARNVGIRRARGDFVLPSSADILFSDAMIGHLAQRRLDNDKFYRVARHDVAESVLEVSDPTERLAHCENNLIEVQRQRLLPYLAKGLIGWPNLFTNAAGDFLLMSRDLYFRLHGLPEESEYHSSQFDGLFCYMAHFAGAKQEVLQEPMRIYHIDHHTSSWKPQDNWVEALCQRLRLSRRAAANLVALTRRFGVQSASAVQDSGVPTIDVTTRQGRRFYRDMIRDLKSGRRPLAYNDETWGMAEDDLEETVIERASWDTAATCRV